MEIRKSFLICIFLLGVLSLGLVCAEDNSSPDNLQNGAFGEIDVEDSYGDTNKLGASIKDSDLLSAEFETGDKEDLNIYMNYINPIYPWTWADSDSDIAQGVYIFFDQYDTTGNTTIYLDDEVIYMCQGEFSEYLVHEDVLWQYYNGNGEHTVKVVYSGDDRYNPAIETSNFELDAYYCNIEDNYLVFQLSSYVSGVLTLKANGKTVFTKYIEATYARYGHYRDEIYRFSLDDLDSGFNHLDVSFTSDEYSFDESFEYYNNSTSKDVAPADASAFSGKVRAGNESKISVGSVDAGNPLLLLALALSCGVLLPRRK